MCKHDCSIGIVVGGRYAFDGFGDKCFRFVCPSFVAFLRRIACDIRYFFRRRNGFDPFIGNLALTETDEGNISVKWKEGDKISLCFVSGETVRTLSDIAVTNIREDDKKADFSFALPEGITAPFDLYGIYGAAFKSDNNSVVLLNANEDEEVTLDYVAPRSAMRFALKDITSMVCCAPMPSTFTCVPLPIVTTGFPAVLPLERSRRLSEAR